MWDFPDDPDLARIARSVYERGGVVAAVCHGPAALVNLTLTDGSRLIAGKRVAGFTNSEEAAVGLTDEVPFLLADKLTEAGAQHVPAPDFTEHVGGRRPPGDRSEPAVRPRRGRRRGEAASAERRSDPVVVGQAGAAQLGRQVGDVVDGDQAGGPPEL